MAVARGQHRNGQGGSIRRKTLRQTTPLSVTGPRIFSLSHCLSGVAAMLVVPSRAARSRAGGIWGGRANVRQVLYMAAMSASKESRVQGVPRSSQGCRQMPKVAIVAVMRKMIITLNAMVGDDVVWADRLTGRHSVPISLRHDDSCSLDHLVGGRDSVAGTVRPRVRAVWWLMTSSTLVDCTTGRSRP
jgi:hypothetical protein